MIKLGYSTGAIAFGDFRLAIHRLQPFHLEAIELSALRVREFLPLVNAMQSLDLRAYSYVAFHAPSCFAAEEERAIVEALLKISHRVDAIVLHPDAVHDFKLWTELGTTVCFENMDKRKSGGRNVSELAALFDRLPQAGLCFDLGHAWQIDRTMTEARQILRRFRARVRQLHVSEVNTGSKHVPLTLASVTAFRTLLDLLPDVPWILESVTAPEKIAAELQYVREAFAEPLAVIPD